MDQNVNPMTNNTAVAQAKILIAVRNPNSSIIQAPPNIDVAITIDIVALATESVVARLATSVLSAKN